MSDSEYNAITVHPGGEIMVNRSFEARYQDCMVECMELQDRGDALEAELADLKQQNTLLRTVVAAWAKENNVGSMTLRDALDAVEFLQLTRGHADQDGMEPPPGTSIERAAALALISDLRSENRALREFVAAHDRWWLAKKELEELGDDDWPGERDAEVIVAVVDVATTRKALAAEHGPPLPGAGEGGE